MTLEISVNGQTFDNWKTTKLARTIDENAGKFQFSSSNVIPANYPVRAGDAVQILINGQARLTGFCDVVESSVEDGIDTITVSGRDNTADLVDSSMPDSVKSIEGPLSMLDLVAKVIAALGANIGVTQSAPTIDEFSELDLFIADAGRNCIEFLTDFARKRQVYLIPDGDGNLDIFRPPEVLLAGVLINRRNASGNNIISSSVRFDHSQRYGRYSSRGQFNFGADPDADYDIGVDVQGEATDDKIRSSRFLEVQPEESMDFTETTDRAVEELNIRLARSTSYTAIVAGLERSANVLWDLGQLTKIDDAFSGMKGVFIVRAVAYSVDAARGTRTTLTMAPPEAYNVRIPTQGDLRRAERGSELQNDEPASVPAGFVR